MASIETEIHWESDAAEVYVQCCYGTDGDQPGDCYTRVGQAGDGTWWVDDGDDDVRVEEYGPYASREEAIVRSKEIAVDQHEGLGDEDAETMLDRLRTEAVGDPDPEGEWCVWWDTALDDSGAVERYPSCEAAGARADQMNDGLAANNPGTHLLCGYTVRMLNEGRWVEPCQEDE